MIKNKLTCLVASFLALSSVTLLSGCEKYDAKLTICNWEDYIYLGGKENGKKVKGIVDRFKDYYAETHDGAKIKVNYQTFSTNEELYAQLGDMNADLICPSDYMIQKLANENKLIPFSYDEANDKYNASLKNWDDNGSPFIRNRFKSEKLNDGSCFLKYAVPYFWGTMGFVYDSDYFEEEELESWECLWSTNAKFKGQFKLKDSVRDTYLTGIFHVYKEEIDALDKTAPDFNAKLSEIFNRCDDETIAKVGAALKAAKKDGGTVRGFEVDDGKSEIVSSKTYHANLAWSGDAVYSMDCGDELEKTLNYVLPKEGSNVWFDGWCMPKGANQALAEEFVNFICRPDNAALCMGEVGYTSPIVGEDMWEFVNETYAAEEGETDTYEVDLSFYFGEVEGGATIKIPSSERGRQFDAQYPTEEQLNRCCVMKDFGAQQTKVDLMWQDIK